MKIVLSSIEPDLYEAWKSACGELDFVELHHGSILEAKCDAVVSPANSFGFMDGGIDMQYTMHFGWSVQERLQKLIQEKHHGELVVGAAEIVETDTVAIPYVIAAPTMRVPMILEESVNPFLAARAALLLVEHGEFRHGPHIGTPIRELVQTVAFPGLGTGVGYVPAEICARQVRAAIDAVVLKKSLFPTPWRRAQSEHQRLYGDDDHDLQRR